MDLPFTQDEFLGVFAAYNAAIQPVQVIAYLLGLVAVIIAVRGGKNTGVIIPVILAIFWAWTGVVYHIIFFSTINGAAYIFGALFVTQSLLFLHTAARPKRPAFRFTRGFVPAVGAIFVVYAMIVYPMLNVLLGHDYPRMPVFGVTPCPMTIFTYGMLLQATTRVPGYLLIIPVAWSIVGISAAINLGIFEDCGLIVAGVLGLILILSNNRRITG